MNIIKLTLFSMALLVISPTYAVPMSDTSPDGSASSSGAPAPTNGAQLATPTAPTAVAPNGAMQTGPAPTPTSPTPSAPNAAAGSAAPLTAPPVNPDPNIGHTAQSPGGVSPTPAATQPVQQ
jgi:hypothetical protein